MAAIERNLAMTRHSSQRFIMLAALLLPAACGFITVNGKPLGASKTAPPKQTAGTEKTAQSSHTPTLDNGSSSGKSRKDAGTSRQAVADGNKANAQLYDAVNEDRVPEELMAALESARARSQQVGDESSVAFLDRRLQTYRFIAGMLALEQGDAGPIKAALGGKLEKQGVLPNKHAKLTITVKRGRCYTVAMKWKRPTGTERERDYAWTASKPGSIQRYGIRHTHSSLPQQHGLCATADTQATLRVEHAASGSKPRLQYVVMSWEKSELPLDQVIYAQVRWADVCSAQPWQKLWLDPIPGSIVFVDNEPLLVSSISVRTAGLILHNASGGQVGGRLAEIRDQPKGPIRFRTQFSMPTCSEAKWAETATSRRAAKCHEVIDRKYDKLSAAAQRRADAARSVAGIQAAQRKLASLGTAEGKARRSKCGALDRKLNAEVERAFNTIVDHYADGSPPRSMGRVTRLQLER